MGFYKNIKSAKILFQMKLGRTKCVTLEDQDFYKALDEFGGIKVLNALMRKNRNPDIVEATLTIVDNVSRTKLSWYKKD